ncbi:hypothetical protein HHX47_DHR10000091 [Lentinula edodes]|nr:hypothetical protein HHX47_DHR10000091 [Lentinula edodes]
MYIAERFLFHDSKWTLLAIFVAFMYLAHRASALRKGRLPPGPRGLPLFGNLFQLNIDAWLTFAEWKEQYGPLVQINVAGQRIVIMNTHKVASDLLDRRGPIYSDRPRFIVASEILTGGLLMPFAQYNDVATASMIWDVIYDKPPITDVEDPEITRINDFTTRLVRAAFPGAHYVEFFTWMKYLPRSVARWKRDAEEWFRKDSQFFEGLFLEAQHHVENGEARPSFATNLIRDKERYGIPDRESAWLAATLYAAGAETTAGVLSWFMLAMILYPDVQTKVQEELDAVVGRDRLPTFADQESLPYLQATVREALRWHPVDPVGVPHQSNQDDWYEGYFIPKGTICIANVWSLNRDIEAYGPDAADFNPRRFLDKNGQLKPALADTKEEGV